MSMTKLKVVLIVMICALTAYTRNINVPGDFKTINDALGNADAGDTILVKRGVYYENITLVMGVVLKGEDPLSTIIDGSRKGPTVKFHISLFEMVEKGYCVKMQLLTFIIIGLLTIMRRGLLHSFLCPM